MTDGPVQKSVKEIKELSAKLRDCPFCKERPQFMQQTKSPGYILRHHPDKPCPARCEIFCDDFDFACRIWGPKAQ